METFAVGHSPVSFAPAAAPQAAAPQAEAPVAVDAGQPAEAAPDPWEAQLVADTTAPAEITAYQFEYDLAEGEELTPEQQADDRMYRCWLAEAQFPAEAGTAIAREVNAFMKRTEGFTEVQHQIEAKRTKEMLQKAWGARAPEMIATAQKVVKGLDRLHNGDVSRFLDETGLGNSATLIMHMAHHGERLLTARKRR